jgi:pimeloyl-ACP methyl ester carboxylesterase
MVLVDPADPEEWLQITEQKKKRVETGAALCRRGVWLARLGIARFVSLLASVGAFELARSTVSLVSHGALRREEESLLAPVNKLPSHLRPALRTFWTQPKFFEALASQIEAIYESAAQVASTGDYGDMPLTVLSAGNSGPVQLARHEAMARLSGRGKHIIASKSGHWIPVDQPELVVESIRQVIKAARERAVAR